MKLFTNMTKPNKLSSQVQQTAGSAPIHRIYPVAVLSCLNALEVQPVDLAQKIVDILHDLIYFLDHHA